MSQIDNETTTAELRNLAREQLGALETTLRALLQDVPLAERLTASLAVCGLRGYLLGDKAPSSHPEAPANVVPMRVRVAAGRIAWRGTTADDFIAATDRGPGEPR